MPAARKRPFTSVRTCGISFVRRRCTPEAGGQACSSRRSAPKIRAIAGVETVCSYAQRSPEPRLWARSGPAQPRMIALCATISLTAGPWAASLILVLHLLRPSLRLDNPQNHRMQPLDQSGTLANDGQSIDQSGNKLVDVQN
jgi:hypothetical protein